MILSDMTEENKKIHLGDPIRLGDKVLFLMNVIQRPLHSLEIGYRLGGSKPEDSLKYLKGETKLIGGTEIPDDYKIPESMKIEISLLEDEKLIKQNNDSYLELTQKGKTKAKKFDYEFEKCVSDYIDNFNKKHNI